MLSGDHPCTTPIGSNLPFRDLDSFRKISALLSVISNLFNISDFSLNNLSPIVPHKYDIGFVVHNVNYDLLYTLEPWCSKIFIGTNVPIIDYVSNEQKNTSYNLQTKVWYMPEENAGVSLMNDIIVEFDASQLTKENFQFITQIPEIIQDSGEIGTMEYDIFKITINKLETYEKGLIKCDV